MINGDRPQNVTLGAACDAQRLAGCTAGAQTQLSATGIWGMSGFALKNNAADDCTRGGRKMIANCAPKLFVAAVLSACFVAGSAHAACGDRPGTPDNVSALALSDTMLQFRWRNTATETVWWDIEVTDPAGNIILSQAGIGQGLTGFHLPAENTFLVGPDTTQCFRVRARTAPHTEGCVSEIWSARVCATSFNCTSGPNTCKDGFVWRAAQPSDLVCVRPEVRQQAQFDNSQAAARRDPNGPFGPNTCVSGFVWRAAFPGDVVCVSPATRAQALQDNSQAAARGACPTP
jgi:hypothetical protein